MSYPLVNKTKTKTHTNINPNSNEKIVGTVERITFHSEESGFCVLRVKARGITELVTIVGHVALVNAGEFIESHGCWCNDKEYGLQFRAQELKVIPPTTVEGIEKYLSSGLIKGVGPHFAKVLVKAFGEAVFEVIDKNPQRLRELPGIGETRYGWITAAWETQKAVREIMVFLQSHGIGVARAVRIYKTYGDDSIAKISANPYCLAAEVYGIGFKTADSLALKLGIPANSLLRAGAGIRYVLQEFAEDGHTAVEREELINKAAEILDIKKDILLQAIKEEIAANNLISEAAFINEKQGELIFLPGLYQAEVSLAKNILRLKNGEVPWGKIAVEKAIGWLNKSSFKLSPSQEEAVAAALVEKVLIITGGPGVGKTTIVNSILKVLAAKKMRIALAAPTGRAAKRLSETSGHPAKTIHRLLEYDVREHGFRRNHLNLLPVDYVVIDEASMVDVILMHHLLKAIPSQAALLLVGDADQLPSVGPGQILSDLIVSDVVPVIKLTEIFRQAKSSKIIVNAHRINQGLFPLKNEEEKGVASDFYLIPAKTPEEIHEKLLKVILERIPQRFKFHPINDVQVLTPMNRGGLGARSLNAILQEKLNQHRGNTISRFGVQYAVGDKVIQLKNNYDKDVYNGDIGTVKSIDLEASVINIDFFDRQVEYEFNELDEVALAYATSIHKSQGSEYPVVVLVLSNQHYMLLQKKLVYTAVTRGKKLVIVIAQMQALAMALKNKNTEKRLTRLVEKLNAE